MITNLNKEIQLAREQNRYFHAKKNGKLTYFPPEVGMTVVFEDGDFGVVLRSPNSLGDYTVKLNTGETIRTNIKSDSVKGFISKC